MTPNIPMNETALSARIAWLQREQARIAPMIKFMSLQASQPDCIASLLSEMQQRADDSRRVQSALDPLDPRFALTYERHKAIWESMEGFISFLTNINSCGESCLKELALRRGQLDDLRKTQREVKQPKY